MDILRVETVEHDNLKVLTTLPQPIGEVFYQGDLLNLINLPCVAIVGSRKATNYGRIVTSQIASELANAGIVIVSGLAIGVDSIAHQAALNANGKTIAILPSGLDKIYPASHYSLAKNILNSGGALVSEYPPTGSSPMKYQFIARNRIIASLSKGVLVTEAAKKSGSLHTAQFALEQGIDVFAIPGNITSENSAGTNQLIKDGAMPVTNSKDILECLGINAAVNGSVSESSYKPTNENEAKIINAINNGHTLGDDILRVTDLEAPVFHQTMTMLEIRGAVASSDTSTWSLT